MSGVAPTGNGPFEFTNSNGQLVSIPLTAFSFDVTGALKVDPNWNSIVTAQPASALRDYMLQQGLLVAAPAASPIPAAIIKAVDTGPAGNNISVTIANIGTEADPTQRKFDITVTETETYNGLTLATVKDALGTTGLVHVDSPPGSASVLDTGGQVTFNNGGSNTKASGSVNDSQSKMIFTLEARDAGADGNKINVTITTPQQGVFTLTAQWKNTSTGVTIGTFQSKVAADLGYLVTAATPAAGIFSVPAVAETNLSGGASSVNASAILIANQ